MKNRIDWRNLAHDQSGAALLILVAVLLVIASLAVGTWYVRGQSRVLEQSQGSATNLDKIKRAIVVFAVRNKRLPCAADGRKTASDSTRGNEDCTITTAYEVVPWRTLGLEEKLALDQWNNRISYHPTTSLTSGTPFNTSIPSGTIKIYTAYNSSGARTGSATDAAYVLISHGPDGAGAFMTTGTQRAVAVAPKAEAENTDADDDYIQAKFDDSSTYFDDLVVYDTTNTICTQGDICTSSGSIKEGSTVTFSGTSRDFVATTSSSTNDTGAPTWQDRDEERRRANDLVISSGSSSRRFCSWYDTAKNLKNRIIRAWVGFYIMNSNATGFTFAFLPGGTTITSGSVPCGADTGYLGFGNNGTRSLNVYGVSNAFAVEIDVTQDATQSDPAGNHFAVDVYDHSDATNNVGTKHASPGATCAGAGCYEGTTTWLEDGQSNYHKLRVELDGMTAGQVTVKAWICRYGTTCGANFTVLSSNYSGTEPSITQVVSVSSAFDTIRFGFTSSSGSSSSEIGLSDLSFDVYQ